ncbi:MAG: ABC transporter ATP-binding protein [Chloroflexi bacterium]|nr:ABC transporter ATP-binding protein [Chloroflexota bacterium]
MLAMALACDPDLLIVDEPTSGLDMLTRRLILELLAELRRQRGLTMLILSHDLDDLAGLTDRTLVLYAGQIAEMGKTAHVLDVPFHPYTWGLVNAYPRMDRAKDLWGIRGQSPDWRWGARDAGWQSDQRAARVRCKLHASRRNRSRPAQRP